MAKSTGIIASAGAAKAASAAPPKRKTSPKSTPPSKSSTKGKGKDSATLSDVSPNSGDYNPPSNDSTLDDGHRPNPDDCFSYSKESYNSRNVTTESTTRLVDNLVKTYTGEYSGIESHDHDSFYRESSGSTSSPYTEHGHDCPHAPSRAHERFERIKEAGEQLGAAQKKVDCILDKAVEARINDSKPVPEAEEKRAEKEQERLTKAEGSLHRAGERLSEKQEFRRQRKLEYTSKRENAEKALLSKYGNSNAALRDHIMETFRPVIAQDSAARNDLQYLENAADWHIKTDSEASRLVKEGKATTPQEPEEMADEKEPKKLERRLDGDAFRAQVRNTSDSGRSGLIEAELKKLHKSTSTRARKEIESRLNEQLSEVQVEQTRSSSNKEEDKRRESVDTLQKAKAERSGKSGQELNPISEAIEDLDSESIRKTHKKLEDIDLGSVTSVLDLERSFGRSMTDVRTDLEHQIARGGKSVPIARKTLSHLNKVVRRSQLMSEGDGWDALMSCITPFGPNLGRFLGLPDGFTGGTSSGGQAELKNDSKVDFKAARRITQRMAKSGSRVDDKRKAKLLAQLGNTG